MYHNCATLILKLFWFVPFDYVWNINCVLQTLENTVEKFP